MNDIRELAKFLLGFMPWLLFLFISGHTLASLERSIILCFIASLIFGFKELRKGFVLQWGTLLFFMVCAITVIFMKSMFVAKNMGMISNGFLACIIWVTIFIGKPFTLQYATAELPKERWNDPDLVRSCRFIAIIWALLLTFSASVSGFRILNPTLFPDRVYFDISIVTILSGSIFTTFYKKYKRNQYLQHNKGEAMKKNVFLFIAVFLLLAVSLYAENAKKISFGDLPAVVQSTALQWVKAEDITKVELITSKETVKYEIESKREGKSKDLTIAQNGCILEVEEALPFEGLPVEVQNEIKKEYPGIEIKAAEAVSLHYYEINGTVDGKKVELKVFATGRIKDVS